MIGKIVKGSGFKGCVRYVMGKQDASLLDSEGVLSDSTASVIRSFCMQTEMNPKIKKPVGHISLSYAKEDSQILTDKKMVELAKEYMEQMGINNTQYIIVRHQDREHPHVHIVFNRINNDGKVISDKNDHYRNEKVCKQLKEKHGLYFSQGKESVKVDRLQGRDKLKYEIYHSVKDALNKSKNWNDFKSNLFERNIEIRLKYKNGTGDIQGVSFVKDGFSFKGSEVDRSFSYSKINAILNKSESIEQSQNSKPIEKTIHNENNSTSIQSGGIISITGFSPSVSDDDNYLIKQKKKKKKKGIRR